MVSSFSPHFSCPSSLIPPLPLSSSLGLVQFYVFYLISSSILCLFLWWSQVLFFAWCLELMKLIVLCIYGSPSASDHRLPKSLRISVARTVFTAYQYLIHWFTWVSLLVATDRPAAVLLWSFCHHEIPCLFHLKFYFSPWILNKLSPRMFCCMVLWDFVPYSGTSLLADIFMSPCLQY